MSFFQNDNELLFQKLAAYCLDELEAGEKEQVQHWIQQNEANASQYRAVQQLLQQSNAETPAIEVDVNKGWNALQAKIGTAQPIQKGKVRRMGWYWAAAAVLTGLVIGSWLFFQSAGANDAEWIAKSGFDTLQLADGTTIVAQGPATVKYRTDFNQGNRDIQLEGSAYFNVHRDTTQPFSIGFEEGKVTVLGTQFYIHQQVQGFEVKVTEGKVKAQLVHDKGEAVLTRGKMVRYNKTANQLTQQDFAEASMLKYENETVQNILKDVFLAKGILIRVNPSLANMKLTTDFVKSSPDEILQALELLTQGRLEKTGANEYRLTHN